MKRAYLHIRATLPLYSKLDLQWQRTMQGLCQKEAAWENQNMVDYTMPFRCMQYDSMEYGQQLATLRWKIEEGREEAVRVSMACVMRSAGVWREI